MELEIITSKSCGHCKQYAELARKYVKVVEYDIREKPTRKIPYSRLYDNGTLIREWTGATLTPLFECMKSQKVKVRFSTVCRDKHTGDLYKRGAVRTFPIERAEELIAAGVAVRMRTRNDKNNNK